VNHKIRIRGLGGLQSAAPKCLLAQANANNHCGQCKCDIFLNGLF